MFPTAQLKQKKKSEKKIILNVRHLEYFTELHNLSPVAQTLPDSFQRTDACSKKEYLEVKLFRTLNEFSNIFFQSFCIRPMI